MATPHPGLADAPLLRAARGLPARHVPGVVHAPGGPVAARVPGAPRRGQHPRRHPRPGAVGRDHAPAGPPLRRRRRHPLQRHRRAGGRHRLRRRRHARASARSSREPFRSQGRPRPAAALRARRSTRPTSAETVRLVVDELGATPLIGFAGAPFTVASYLIEGRPSRTYGLTKAMMHGDPTLWRELLDRLADMAIASLLAQVEAGASAIQLFDSWAGSLVARRLRRPRAAGQRQGVRRPRGHRRAPHPLRRRHRRAARPHGRRRRRRGRASTGGCPLDVARAAGARQGACRATSTRPCAWPRGTSWPTAPATCCAATAAARATSSTSATACSPSSTPACCPGGRPRARGGPVRRWLTGWAWSSWPTAPRRRPPTSRRTTRTSAAGSPPTPEQLADLARRYDAIGGTSPLAERTEAQRPALQAALDAAGPGPLPRGARPEARRPVHRGRRRHAGRRTASTAIVGLVLAPHFSRFSVGQYQERLAAAAAAASAAGRGHRQLAPRTHLPRLPRRGRARTAGAALPERTKVLFTAHSLPERAARRRPVPRPAPRVGRRGRRGAGLDRWAGWSLAGSRPGARRSRGAAPTSSR